jgi:hypothetical protein
MKREVLRFDVFGHRIDVLRTDEGWRAVFPGGEGKARPANITIPSELGSGEIAQYLADLYHESASPRHPTVRLL